MADRGRTGEKTVLIVTEDKDAATPVTLSSYARNVEVQDNGKEYNATTYAEAQTGEEAFVPGLTDHKITMEVRVPQSDADDIMAITKPRTKLKAITYRPEGTGAGLPQEIWADGFVLTRSRPAPYNDIVFFKVEIRVNGAANDAAQAA